MAAEAHEVTTKFLRGEIGIQEIALNWVGYLLRIQNR
jgi:hypothetical protein